MSLLQCPNPMAGTIRQQQLLSRLARCQQLAAPRRRSVRAQAASTADFPVPEPLQSTLAYAKAFMTVALRHATDTAFDAAANLNMALAEQPRRMQDFQDEIRAVAERELRGNSQRLISPTSSGSTSSPESSSRANDSSANTSVDLAALVDDLRADIAASRSLLQQIRLSEQTAQ